MFRLGCIHSNRQAPSRDSAITFANLERVKHLASGGWWYNEKRRSYVHSSEKILQTILDVPAYAHLLGLSNKKERIPGEHCMFNNFYHDSNAYTGSYTHKLLNRVKTYGKKPAASIPFRQTLLAKSSGIPLAIDDQENVYICESIVTQNSDKASVGSCVLVRQVGIISQLMRIVHERL